MTAPRLATASGALLASGLLSVVLAAPALAVCDAYSGGCPSPAPTLGGSTGGAGTGGDTDSGSDGGAEGGSNGGASGGSVSSGSAGTTSTQPRTLPFTGGEVVLLSAIGVGALAGGTALVVAGRRKSSPAV